MAVWQCGQSGIGGACRVAVRQCGQSGIAVGGEVAIARSRLAGWLGRTMARPYIAAVHGAAGRWWVHGFLGCFLGDLLRNGEIFGVGGNFFVKGL